MAAAAASHIHLVKLLLDHGADVNIELKKGALGSVLAVAYHAHAPYYYALHDMITFLVQKGADDNMPLKYGKFCNALEAAEDRLNNQERIDALLRAGAVKY